MSLIEALSEDTEFSGAELAAAVASKCFYHLQEYNDSLRLALCAGSYFDIYAKGEYVETLLAKCIDEYTALRLKQETQAESTAIDPRMEAIIEQMFRRCYADNCFEQAIGIALDTRRGDKVEETCQLAIQAGNERILGYTFQLCQGARNIPSREFRLYVIGVLVRLYQQLAEPDYTNMCFGLQYLDQPQGVAEILDKLCHGSDDSALHAYQIAFDLHEAENQSFILRVVAAFPVLSQLSTTDTSVTPDSPYTARLMKLRRILMESFDIELTLNFLFKHTHADNALLNTLKPLTEGRSVLHNATVVTHGYMHCGTTIDSFLRDNLEWLGKANNWNKFTAVASIGVVHKGHLNESMNLLAPYLPRGGVSASPYSESGALYALGLIHANKGGTGDSATITYLTDALRNAGNEETVQHGACLGLGLAAMATGDENLFELLKNTLFCDSAIAGEGSGLALGLIMLGQSHTPLAQSAIPDLLNYIHDTKHEKIIRALALSVAMMVYGKEESAEALIEQLTRDRDPIVRYGGMYAIAMAYVGTADNSAIRRLLHVAVSDVNDDVRRAAVTCLGFVVFRTPETLPSLVELLAESFNPHVRYGACMAVGIGCAGTGLKEAIELLKPMLEDQIDYVRQGACMAMALVLMQISETKEPAVKKFREHLTTVINDKHQTITSKSGAILASGLIDAGGRNCVVSMVSRAGFIKQGAVIGVMLWLQYWYWYPLMHLLSLAFSPTMIIGLNKDFNIPKQFAVKCAAAPSMFAYPKADERKEDKKERVVTAVLSTTAKTKAREARKEAKKLGRQMSTDSNAPPPADGVPLERVASHLSTTSYLSVEVELKS